MCCSSPDPSAGRTQIAGRTGGATRSKGPYRDDARLVVATVKDEDDGDGEEDSDEADAEAEQPVVGDGHVAMDGGEQRTPGHHVHDLDRRTDTI